ncbi:hypothetical protein PROFUN_06245 [Planoprotostelium fungivorum]|uniref:Flavin reductase like domain-containing protein n=1 Tax=Planoprotostelium fungivorum TaxID=1890364 RepID=A0A2P6NE35_9EUKA|nr:hypothetical protein PROFUN_06245 [Planoprotostelium fungivorum]
MSNFKEVEATRPDWVERSVTYTKTKNPNWKLGDGPTDGGECLSHKHIAIDPYEDGRPSQFNYKLLSSAIVPRPIGVSSNLAPFSHFQLVLHDPPIFVIGFTGGQTKDTLHNLIETEECCVNIISEHMIEAANLASVDTPYGVSEWTLSGLHPAPCTTVACSRVQESVFAMECKLVEIKEFHSRKSNEKTGSMAVIEGVKFWVREDAINEEKNAIDLEVLRPVSRVGGVFGRTTDLFEIPRPRYEDIRGEAEQVLKNARQ